METNSFTLVVKNGSVQVIPEMASAARAALPAVFLALTFTAGLCLNALLVFTVGSSASLRRVPFNALLLLAGAAAALDCLLDVGASVAFVTTLERAARAHPDAAAAACRANAAIALFAMHLQAASVGGLATERALAARSALAAAPADAPRARPRTAAWYIFCGAAAWYAALLAVPVAAARHHVHTRPFPSRYSCGVCAGGGALYPAVALAAGALLPWLVAALAVALTWQRLTNERRRRRRLEEAALHRSHGGGGGGGGGGAGGGGAGLRAAPPLPWHALLPAGADDAALYAITAALLGLHLVLAVPQALSTLLAPFVHHPPTTAPAANPADPDKAPAAPELYSVPTGSYDTIFIWCRYELTIVAPCVVFFLHKELRRKCYFLFCCCCGRGNSVTHLEEARSVSALLQKKAERLKGAASKLHKKKKKKESRSKYVRMASYRTPVLFATSEGLHLRLVVDPAPCGPPPPKQRLARPNFVCEFCDLAIVTTAPLDTSLNGNRSKQPPKGVQKPPPRFGFETISEPDMHVSDHWNDSGNKPKYAYVDRNSGKLPDPQANVKKKFVRFAQNVDKIPLTESGMWNVPSHQTAQVNWEAFRPPHLDR